MADRKNTPRTTPTIMPVVFTLSLSLLLDEEEANETYSLLLSIPDLLLVVIGFLTG